MDNVEHAERALNSRHRARLQVKRSPNAMQDMPSLLFAIFTAAASSPNMSRLLGRVTSIIRMTVRNLLREEYKRIAKIDKTAAGTLEGRRLDRERHPYNTPSQNLKPDALARDRNGCIVRQFRSEYEHCEKRTSS